MTDIYDIDWSAERDHLASGARTAAEWYTAVAGRLCRASDRLALDVGCGAAGMSLALSRALPEPARVVALDGDDAVLEAARNNLASADVAAGRVEFLLCDLHGGLDALHSVVHGSADVIWASAVVHHVGDQQAAIDALATLLASGGRLAVAEGGLDSRHLPWDVGIGEPGLERRLDAAENVWFTRMRERLHGHVRLPYGWTDALSRAGLTGVTTWSSLIDQPAPLAANDQATVLESLRHRIDRIRDTELLAPTDLAAWDQLLADDAAALRERTDVYRLAVRSVHVGIAA